MKSIFWVEDGIDSFEAFSFLLSDRYSITRAVDFEDAIKRLHEHNYDVIIVDIIIPSGKFGITLEELLKDSHKYFGLEFIKNLRENGIKTPIIVLSVVSDRSTIDQIQQIDNQIDILWKYDSNAENLKEVVENIIQA